jgi:DNA-binding transcriptional ArsR family regulator
MKGSPNIARTAALIGDLARASMLTALMSGKALTASELAREGGITVQTASSHLRKLEEGGLLQVRKQGRHKYFALANEDVASVLEALMGITAGNDKMKSRAGPADAALRHSRVCYNHLAGDTGIQLYDSLVAQGHLCAQNDELTLTPSGSSFAFDFGIDIEELKAARAVLCRECLDWSERRSHLAGSLGRAFLTRFETLRWVKRIDDSRIIKFSRNGADSFNSTFRVPA